MQMGEMFTGVGTEIALDEIDRLKARIAQLEADKNHLYDWGRGLETENKNLREQLATELVYGPDRSQSSMEALNMAKVYTLHRGREVVTGSTVSGDFVLAHDYDQLKIQLRRARAALVRNGLDEMVVEPASQSCGRAEHE
jgi:hypothetical protein